VFDFLVLDPLFPRSVIHALMTCEEALSRLEPPSPRSGRGHSDGGARRTIGRVLADLRYLHPDRLFEGLPERLHRLERDMSEVSDMVARSYFETAPVLGWNLEESRP